MNGTPAHPGSQHQDAIDAVRSGVTDLLDGDAALQSFASDTCMLRFLRARGGCVEKAIKMLRNTLEWRQQTKPHLITWEDVQENGKNGRLEVAAERDVEGRPILWYLLKRKMVMDKPEDSLRYWIYTLETLSKLADDTELGTVLVACDMEAYSDSVLPPLTTRIEAIRLAQSHYPERLAKFLISRPPTLFWLMWTAISPFLDCATRNKVCLKHNLEEMHEALKEYVPDDLIYEYFGGTRRDEWDLAAYSKRLMALDSSRGCHAYGIHVKADADA